MLCFVAIGALEIASFSIAWIAHVRDMPKGPCHKSAARLGNPDTVMH